MGRFSLAPARSRKGGGLSKPRLLKIAFAIFAFCVVPAIASPANTIFTSLVSFDVTNGSNPYYASLIQGTDGSLYGTTAYGGATNKTAMANLWHGLQNHASRHADHAYINFNSLMAATLKQGCFKLPMGTSMGQLR